MGEAARRWSRLVRARLEEYERLRGQAGGAGAGAIGPAFWDRRATRFAKGPMASADGDPLLPRLRRAVRPGSTFLDVGSGPGRFSLAVAPRAARVVAVDPSRRMLQILRRRAREAGVTNLKTVTGLWQEVDVEPADVVLCAHVLPLIADAGPFLAKLDAAGRRTVFVYVGAFAADALLDPFWRHFHGSSRKTPPSYLDALAVLAELGIDARVEVVEIASRSRYASLDEAVDAYRENLVLADTAEVRRELAALLGPWLQRRGGALRPPLRTQPAAILSWVPRGAG